LPPCGGESWSGRGAAETFGPARERLSWVSSWCPWFAVPDDGVEDSEELAGGGDDGDELWLAIGDEPVAEGLEGGVVTGGDEGAHEEGGADGCPAAADEALAAPLAGLAGVGSEAGESGDLLWTEAAQLGQFRQQGAGDGLADSGD